MIDALVWSSLAFGASTDLVSVLSGNKGQSILWNGSAPVAVAGANPFVAGTSFLNYGLQIAADTNVLAKVGLTGTDPTAGTLTFAAGTTGGTFTITVNGTPTANITFSTAGGGATTAAAINAAIVAAYGANSLVNCAVGADAFHYNLTGLSGTCSAANVALTGVTPSVTLTFSTAFLTVGGFQPKHFQTTGAGLFNPKARTYTNANTSALGGFLKSIVVGAANTFQFYGGFSNIVLRPGTGVGVSVEVLGAAAAFKYAVSWDWAEYPGVF